ncbi:MAG TPA: hypothetical protein VFV96_07905 [Verrucomicrobiae bacterium]|nr:hypothetical protein [Verrucomicrobiae bacterium]
MEQRSQVSDILRFSIGGCFGHRHELRWSRGKLTYATFQAGCLETMKRRRLNPTPDEWAAFWSALDRIGVWHWERDYPDPGVLDGIDWQLELRHDGRAVASAGSNCYPGGNGPEYSRESAFGQFLQALQKLSGVEWIR